MEAIVETAKTIEFVFAERRIIVYEIFAEALLERLLDEGNEALNGRFRLVGTGV